MHTLRRLSFFTAGLVCSASIACAQSASAYLETAPLSILWNFTITGVANSTTPLAPLVEGVDNPDIIRPTERISVDTGLYITYTNDNGNQAFFVKHFQRKILEEFAESSRTLSGQAKSLPDGTEKDEILEDIEFFESEIAYLKGEIDGRWEITAVREPQNTVAGCAGTPYSLFLTRIEYTRGRPSLNYDTGLRIEPIYTAGNSTETLTSGVVTKATGSYTTHFRLVFKSDYYTDPLYLLTREARAEAIPGKDYNTKLQRWEAFGTGYMTYSIRSTPGPAAAVLPTKIKITGHGTWLNVVGNAEGYPIPYRGIAPLSIKMGEIKYQNRNLFPAFTSN